MKPRKKKLLKISNKNYNKIMQIYKKFRDKTKMKTNKVLELLRTKSRVYSGEE
jgi:hypothetical protein